MAKIMGKGFSYDDVLILPKYNKILSRKDVDLKTKVSRNIRLAIPLIAANMDTICEAEMAIAIGKLGGLGIIHRYLSIDSQVKEIKKIKSENLIAAAAIGIKDYLERVPKLIESGLELLVLDIAHGHSKYAGKTLDWIKKNYPQVDVMVGNIATKDAAHYFFSKGADAIKVGVGPGAACRTREVTGFGVPQLSAIMDVARNKEYFPDVKIIADGGIKNSGDIVKALAAGADTVMIGSLLAGCDEAPNPGEYYGNASEYVNNHRAPEGFYGTVKKTGPVEDVIKELAWGIRSGVSYGGATNLKELRENAEFILCTAAGQIESSVRI